MVTLSALNRFVGLMEAMLAGFFVFLFDALARNIFFSVAQNIVILLDSVF